MSGKEKILLTNFSNSRADNSDSSGPISSIIELIQDPMVIYILTKFGADWLIFVDASVHKMVKGMKSIERKGENTINKFSNSRADNSDSSGPISSIIELLQDPMVIYILTKFGADWLIFVDARVFTRK